MSISKSQRLNERKLLEVVRALPVLEMIRKERCGYFGPQCDCKYGYDGKTKGEQTGCPELRVAIGALKDYEFMSKRLVELEKSIDNAVESRLREKLTGILESM